MSRLNAIDTIVAISSASGPALRSIVRLSGPNAWQFSTELLLGMPGKKPSAASCFNVQWQPSGCRCADVQIQFWPSGRSYTGQELVEWHLPGPNGLAEVLIEELVKSGARPAEPGEFSLRAFLSGRIDLTRAEAISSIFQSVSHQQLQVALDQLAGGLAAQVDGLRNRLLDLLAWIEATLDFVEESDVSPITRNMIGEELRGAAYELNRLGGQWTERRTALGSPRVLLVGPPNAGKSALFNALSFDASALVSPVAGTTRDYLETEIRIDSKQKIRLIDTAGLGNSDDQLDLSSQLLSVREQLMADLILVCLPIDEREKLDFNHIIQKLPEQIPHLTIATKADLQETSQPNTNDVENSADVIVSALTGQGLDQLRLAMMQKLNADTHETVSVVATTHARARQSLRTAAEALQHAASTIVNDLGDELVAMDLRTAVEALDLITGRDVTEETLDRVFSKFCIGK